MKLLVTGAWKCTHEQLNALRDFGHEILFMQNESDPITEEYESVEGVICNALFLHNDIEAFKELKYIQLTSAGFDRVPMDFVEKKNIVIHNARGVYSIPMAEFAIAGVLQLYKQMRCFSKNQEVREWKKYRNLLELHGKNVAIIGCGNVGCECAKRFKAFGCNIIAVDIVKPEPCVYDEFYRLEEIEKALSLSDVIVLTLPLTKNTRKMFSENLFGKIKKGSVLVNIARGAIVDEASLISAINKQILFGAVLDVFEEEPLRKDSALWDMENVIVTPHNSFEGEKNGERLFNVIRDNIKRFVL